MTPDSRVVAEKHLVPLVDGQWALWRWVGLRGSGFPSQEILRLVPAACSETADESIKADAYVEQCRLELLAQVRTALDELRATGQWTDTEGRRLLLNMITVINKGKLPQQSHRVDQQLNTAIAELTAASANAKRARENALQTLQNVRPTIVETLWAMIQEPRFREAMLWQNHEAYQSMVAPMLDPTASTSIPNAIGKQKLDLLIKYLQRYYTKNDSIGFFGPIGWATLVMDGAPITVEPGSQLLATRTVSFEQWCVDALAVRWSRLDGMRPWIEPRRLPTTCLSGTTLHLADQSVVLPAAQEKILRAALDLCDGTHTARAIAATLVMTHATQFADTQAVYNLLEVMEASGLISWAFNLPVHPESFERLAQALERVGEPSVSAPAREAMRLLESDRQAIAEAAGNPEQLDTALGQLAKHFINMTGQSATQAHGRTYGARTLVYEDCRRDVTTSIGPAVWREISEPLSLLLTSARWMTFQIAQQYRVLFTKLYQQVVSEGHGDQILFMIFWQRIQPYLFGARTNLIDQVLDELQQRWETVLRLPEGQRSVHYRSADLRLAVTNQFAAPGPGWKMARYHSPDILLAAASPAAINAGEYIPVMGELHVGSNTLRASLFVRQHPAPEELLEAVASDIPDPCVIPVEPKYWPGTTARTHNLLVTPKDFRLLATSDSSWYMADPQTLSLGELVIAEIDGELRVQTHDQQYQFECVEFVSAALAQMVVDRFKLLSARPHTPRITIDRLVVNRETWRFDGEVFATLFSLSESEQFIEMRRWMEQHGFPRYVFVRISSEQKPFFVDFANPLFVALLVKMVRQAYARDRQDIRVTISEMLPSLDELWLIDAQGQRYTSELRFVAVDQVGMSADEDWGYL